MPRLSIDISAEQHSRLKAIAALKGQSIRDYVLSRTLSDLPATAELSEAEALAALSAYLAPRIEAAKAGKRSSRSVAEIARAARDSLET